MDVGEVYHVKWLHGYLLLGSNRNEVTFKSFFNLSLTKKQTWSYLLHIRLLVTHIPSDNDALFLSLR